MFNTNQSFTISSFGFKRLFTLIKPFPQTLTFDFNEFSGKNDDLPAMVVKRGTLLIKNVPNLKQAHSIIKNNTVYSNARQTWAHLKDFPATVEVSNIINRETGRMGWFKDKEIIWHTNGICMKEPETCVALFCSIPSDEGGETEIINTRKIYNDLSRKTLLKLKNISINYNLKLYKFDNYEAFDDYEAGEFFKHGQKYPKLQSRTAKPLIYQHPFDGEYGLFFPFPLAESVVGFSKSNSNNILRELKELCLMKKYRSFIKWKKNDLLFIDQIHTLHRRRAFKGQRQLFRICFYWKGDKINTKIPFKSATTLSG